jgi:hypothetical protein
MDYRARERGNDSNIVSVVEKNNLNSTTFNQKYERENH